MLTSEAMAELLAERIGHVYFRPLMYGGSAEGVELILDCYHGMWADLHERREEYQALMVHEASSRRCGAASFSWGYKERHPGAPEAEVSEYIVSVWGGISRRLGVPVPYRKLVEAMPNNPLGAKFLEEEDRQRGKK